MLRPAAALTAAICSGARVRAHPRQMLLPCSRPRLLLLAAAARLLVVEHRTHSSSSSSSSSSDNAPPAAAANTPLAAAANDKTTASANSILAEYSRLVDAGRLRQDDTQRAAVQALQLLQEALVLQLRSRAARQAHAEPAAASASGDSNGGAAAGAADAEQQAPPHPAVQGAYLFGPVGSGKTLLMDTFLSTLPEAVELPAGSPGVSRQLVPLRSQRLHYHEFMLRVHEQLHQLQQALPKIVTRSRAGLPVYRFALPPEDPVVTIARGAAADLDLLCLDELHVTDVADAMLLSRLFGELSAHGCMLVFTSNRRPRDLYKGGLSRRFFMPFIRLIDERLLQLRVGGGTDYRLLRSGGGGGARADEASSNGGGGMWLLGSGGEAQLQRQWAQLVQQMADVHGAAAVSEGPAQLPLPFGRRLWVPRAVTVQLQQQQQQQQQQSDQLAAAAFSFQQLCGNQGSARDLSISGALSSNDYLALARACPAVFLSGVPQLTPKQRDEARRLVTLVDVLYEAHTLAAAGSGNRVRLCVSAAVPPHELFLPLLVAAARAGVNPNLGRAGQQRLDVAQLLQDYGGGACEAPSAAAPAPAPGTGADEAPALLPEEVLMYHRAASRLAELCTCASVEECE